LQQDYKILVQAKKDSLDYLQDKTKNDDLLKEILVSSVYQS